MVKKMNNKAVMTAIERRMNWLFDNVITNPKNDGKDLSKYKQEIVDLHEAYYELRGRKGKVIFVAGMSVELNNVDSIYELTIRGKEEM